MLSDQMEHCPFCGTDDVSLSRLAADEDGEDPSYYFSCPTCGTVGHQGIWRESAPSA